MKKVINYPFNQPEISTEWKNNGIEKYAIKSILTKSSLSRYIILENKQNGHYYSGKISTAFTEGELYHWPHLYHRSLAPLLDIIHTSEIINIFISSYMKQTLRDIIHQHEFAYHSDCFNKKKIYTQDILWGLDYLHRKSLCLLNICDENIFICQKEDKAVISDFSCLTRIHKDAEYKFKLSFLYKAPELIKDTLLTDPIPAEMWSVGVLILEVFLSHMVPWTLVDFNSDRVLEIISKMDDEVLKTANRGSIVTPYNLEEFKIFVSSFLRKNPINRCSAKDAAATKFIQSVNIQFRNSNLPSNCQCPYTVPPYTANLSMRFQQQYNPFTNRNPLNSEFSKSKKENKQKRTARLHGNQNFVECSNKNCALTGNNLQFYFDDRYSPSCSTIKLSTSEHIAPGDSDENTIEIFNSMNEKTSSPAAKANIVSLNFVGGGLATDFMYQSKKKSNTNSIKSVTENSFVQSPVSGDVPLTDSWISLNDWIEMTRGNDVIGDTKRSSSEAYQKSIHIDKLASSAEEKPINNDSFVRILPESKHQLNVIPSIHKLKSSSTKNRITHLDNLKNQTIISKSMRKLVKPNTEFNQKSVLQHFNFPNTDNISKPAHSTTTQNYVLERSSSSCKTPSTGKFSRQSFSTSQKVKSNGLQENFKKSTRNCEGVLDVSKLSLASRLNDSSNTGIKMFSEDECQTLRPDFCKIFQSNDYISSNIITQHDSSALKNIKKIEGPHGNTENIPKCQENIACSSKYLLKRDNFKPDNFLWLTSPKTLNENDSVANHERKSPLLETKKNDYSLRHSYRRAIDQGMRQFSEDDVSDNDRIIENISSKKRKQQGKVSRRECKCLQCQFQKGKYKTARKSQIKTVHRSKLSNKQKCTIAKFLLKAEDRGENERYIYRPHGPPAMNAFNSSNISKKNYLTNKIKSQNVNNLPGKKGKKKKRYITRCFYFRKRNPAK